MTTRLFLVRHAQTTLGLEDRFAGTTDVLLSDGGEQQALRLGERLSRVPIAAVYASSLKRALRTAQVVAGFHKLAVQPIEGLREIHYGRWEGRTRAEVAREFDSEYKRWEYDPFASAPPGGETGRIVLERSLPAVQQIIARHAGGIVLVVSHRTTIRLLISHFLGLDKSRYRDRLDQRPCCLNILEFGEALQARLALLNDTSHYADGW